MDGMKIVAYKVDGEKHCQKCFGDKFHDLIIKFTPVYLAVQFQSQIKNCSSCGKDLMEDEN